MHIHMLPHAASNVGAKAPAPTIGLSDGYWLEGAPQLAALKEAASTIVDIIMDPSSLYPLPSFSFAYRVFYDLTIGASIGPSQTLADRHAMLLGIVTGGIATSASKWTAHLRTTGKLGNLLLAKDLLYMPKYKLMMNVLMFPARYIDSLANEILACFEEAWEHLPESPVVSLLMQNFENAQKG